MELWKIERIRDHVDELEGAVDIRVYDAAGTQYKIWYNSRDRVALYGRVVWDAKERRDHLMKAWLQELYDAINSDGTRILVQCANAAKTRWFGAMSEDGEEEMEPIEKAYDYVITLDQTSADLPADESPEEDDEGGEADDDL